VSGFRLALITLLLAISGAGGASAARYASGGLFAVSESVSSRFDGIALAARDGALVLTAAEPGGAEQEPSANAANSGRHSFAAGTTWLWYVLLSAALLVAMALFLLLALWLGRRVRDDLRSTRPSQPARPLAVLESQDGSSRRHAVTGSCYRIGRHSNNDLSIHDASVSRQHAEINLKGSGSFTITDLDSMNGVFVNQKKIDSVILADGDIVEIGDKSFRFRITERAGPDVGQTSAR
jgi:hypothetical protein